MKNKNLSEKDYELFASLVRLSPEMLHTVLVKYLSQRYDEVYTANDYIYAVGSEETPVALIAHMDTVFKNQPTEEIYFDRKKGVIWSPDGLGADDRAGVFAIIKIIQSLPKDNLPSIVFTQGEEVGGVGALAFVEAFPQPKVKTKYVIELDRRGTNDCVFYDCDNRDFIAYVEDFGFKLNFGSFTDISFICPTWGIAGVNLSIGYEDEHSFVERLFVGPMLHTITRVLKMLAAADKAPSFEYIEKIYAKNGFWKNYYSYPMEDDYTLEDELSREDKCVICGKVHSAYEMVYVINELGEEEPFCPDCVAKHLDWCELCGLPFEKKDTKGKEFEIVCCPDCYNELMNYREMPND